MNELLLLDRESAASVVGHQKLLDPLALQLRQLGTLVAHRFEVDWVQALVSIGKADFRLGGRAILHLQNVVDDLSSTRLSVLLCSLVGGVLLHALLLSKVDVACLVRCGCAPLLVELSRLVLNLMVCLR